MKSTMRILVCCLLLSAGCRSTDLFSRWSKDDAVEGTLAKAEGGLPAPSRNGQQQNDKPQVTDSPDWARENSPVSTTSNHIRQGQDAVAQWYNDPRASHLKTAEEQFQAELRTSPNSVDAHHGLAIVADLRKDYATAEKHYSEALIAAPTNAKILGDLGYSYLLQNRLADSEMYLNRALSHDPNNQNAIKHLGDVYSRKGQTDLARSTYRRVLNESEIEQALAENSAQPESNLFDRLRNNQPSEQEEFAANLQRQLEQGRQEQQRQLPPANAAFANATPPSGDEIRARLAQIDHERSPQSGGGPILIGDPGDPLQRLPANTYGTPGAAPSQPTGNLGSTSGNSSTFASSGSMFQPGQRAENAFQNYQAQNAYPQQPSGGGFQSQAASQPVISPGPGATDPQLAQLNQPWGQGVQQTGGSPATGSGVGPAYFEGQANSSQVNNSGFSWTQDGTPSQASPAAATQYPAGNDPFSQMPTYGAQSMSTGGNNPPHVGTSAPTTGSDASREAARMGMGFGPGSMFPMFSSSTPTMHPGTNSLINGAAMPAPQRFLPGDPQQPLDMNSQMQTPATNYSQLQNNLGHALPTATPFMTQPAQVGTPALMSPGTAGPSSNPGNFHPYQQQLQQSNNNLNSAVQQLGGQQFQNQGFSAGGVTQAGGQLVTDPRLGGQYTVPNPQAPPANYTPLAPAANSTMQPPQYPFGNGAGNAVGAPLGNVQSPAAGGSYVIPEAYRGRTNSAPAAPTNSAPPAWANPGNSRTAELPAIIPAG